MREGIETLHLEDRPFALDDHGPIFILGCPRSGTTFLSHCLATIDDLEEFVGVLVPPRFMHLLASAKDELQKEHMLLVIRDIFWQSFWRRKLYKDERLLQVVKRNAALSTIWKKPSLSNSLFCYKEPFLCFAAVEFAKHFGKGKFIHIIRDGRDNADSMDRTYPHALSDAVLKDEKLTVNNNSEIGMWRRHKGYSIPWWVEEGMDKHFAEWSKYERNLYMWSEMVSRARQVSQHVGSDRYLEVRYEDFVQEPVPTAQRILAFLGREVNSRMRAQLNKAFSSSVSINKRNRTGEEADRAGLIAGELLSELGYND